MGATRRNPVALVVQKFGGTSVGNLDRMRNVSELALRCQREGNQVVLIVSAMSGETNRLLALAHQISPTPDMRELDSLASTGEQVSAALVAMTIQQLGGRARSFLGHQVRISTDAAYTKARIQSIEGSKLLQTVQGGSIAVVAGFQGIDPDGSITTLGRGGSDTTAVAIAAAIKADVCEIYTDVDGVYTTDPNICPSARKIDRISYEEMLELASLGAKVLQIRSVEVAMKYGVPVHVRSSFSDRTGTMVVGEEGFESVAVAGVAYDKGEAKVQLVRMKDKPGVVAKIFGMLAEHNVSVDMIIQSPSRGGNDTTDVTFTVAKTDLPRAKELIEKTAQEYGSEPVEYDPDIVKVSIVGLGMRSHAGVAAKMFGILASEGINIQAISTSEIKISCIIAAKYTELAVRALHEGFGLDKPPAA
ncbi:MAG TPA: aspartate kinase [Polyangiaceae bacterium]|nr:aspartate kinase [Polyangiaceae bacterium]